MVRRMPVLVRIQMLELMRKLVDDRHNFVAAGHRQRPAGAEIILNIDYDQSFFGHGCPVSEGASCDSCKAQRKTATQSTSFASAANPKYVFPWSEAKIEFRIQSLNADAMEMTGTSNPLH